MPSTDPKYDKSTKELAVEDDEPDDWDKRVLSTGCAAENLRMTECIYDKKDWRLCNTELESFRNCWKVHQNDKRTETKDA